MTLHDKHWQRVHDEVDRPRYPQKINFGRHWL